MTKPKLSNQPYHHLLGALNVALPLEYAIRAGKELSPQEFIRLKKIDDAIHCAWADSGYSDDVIRQDGLVDSCWDFLQLGYVEERAPTRHWSQEEKTYLMRVRNELVRQFAPLLGEIRLPFADRYRLCDLLNGNDIAEIIVEINRKKGDIANVVAKASVPISKFVLSIRVPILRHRGSIQQVHFTSTGDAVRTHIGVMLGPDMELEDVDGALHEFLYHYAMFRKERKPLHAQDAIVNELLMRWGGPSKPSMGAEVTQLNEIHSALHGLYCWDRSRHHAVYKSHGSVAKAILDVQGLYSENGKPTEEVIYAHFQKVKKRINLLRENELKR